MDNFMAFLENNLTITYLVPVLMLVIGELIKLIVDNIRERNVGIPYKVKRNGDIDLLKKYCERNRVLPIVSYGDNNALKVISKNDRGKIVVQAEYDLKRLPEAGTIKT